jgi:hypothetical protein
VGQVTLQGRSAAAVVAHQAYALLSPWPSATHKALYCKWCGRR